MCAIVNASVLEGKVPSIWKKGNVVPVAKVRPPMSAESDIRPISLTPTVSKALESIFGRWILDVVGSQLDDHQFGSLKGRSTTHALLDMLYHRNKSLDDGQSVRVLFVDYTGIRPRGSYYCHYEAKVSWRFRIHSMLDRVISV